MRAYLLGAFVIIGSTALSAPVTQSEFVFKSKTQTLTVSQTNEGFAIELLSEENGGSVRKRLGTDFQCSDGIFGDGSLTELKILNCERQLNDTTFLLVNVYPNKDDLTKLEAETELFDSGLGSIIYKKYASDFSRVSL